MAFFESEAKRSLKKQNGTRLVTIASVLSVGLLGAGAASAAGFGDGARISTEGLDASSTFVRFGGDENGNRGLPAAPQDLSVLLTEVESVLGEPAAMAAVPVSAEAVQVLVTQAQTLVAPILGAMGGGTLPNLAGLSLGDLPLGGFGAGGGGAPLALPGLEGLDAALPTGNLALGDLGNTLGGVLGDPLGGGLGGSLPVGGVVDGVVDGVLGGVTGGLPTVPVIGGLLGQ